MIVSTLGCYYSIIIIHVGKKTFHKTQKGMWVGKGRERKKNDRRERVSERYDLKQKKKDNNIKQGLSLFPSPHQ